MELIAKYNKLFDEYKELNKMTSQAIYFDKTYTKRVYCIRLYDYAKRNYQIRSHQRTTSWILIYDGNISKHLGLKALNYRKLMKDFGAKYNKENGIYFESQEECDLAIKRLYKYVYKNQLIELGDKYEQREIKLI